jgi:hypothetical protein
MGDQENRRKDSPKKFQMQQPIETLINSSKKQHILFTKREKGKRKMTLYVTRHQHHNTFSNLLASLWQNKLECLSVERIISQDSENKVDILYDQHPNRWGQGGLGGWGYGWGEWICVGGWELKYKV